jgi:hypothetical protein
MAFGSLRASDFRNPLRTRAPTSVSRNSTRRHRKPPRRRSRDRRIRIAAGLGVAAPSIIVHLRPLGRADATEQTRRISLRRSLSMSQRGPDRTLGHRRRPDRSHYVFGVAVPGAGRRNFPLTRIPSKQRGFRPFDITRVTSERLKYHISTLISEQAVASTVEVLKLGESSSSWRCGSTLFRRRRNLATRSARQHQFAALRCIRETLRN